MIIAGPHGPAEALAPCVRCAALCAVRPTPPPAPRYGPCGEPIHDTPAWGLKAASSPDARGLCAECGAHWYILTVDGLRWSYQDGPASFLTILALPTVQGRLGSVLARMHPELGAIDWGRLLAQWDLPWPDDWPITERGATHSPTAPKKRAL